MALVSKKLLVMDAVISLNRRTFNERLALLDKDFERWIASLQLLFLVRACSCGRGGMTLCTEIKKGRVKGNKYSRCKKRECSKKLGFYSGTFFEKTSLSLKDVFCLSSY